MGKELEAMEKKHHHHHFVLVHGIGHGAWCWYKLVPLLRLAGHRVTAVDLAASGIHPQRLDEVASFADYAEPLMQAIAAVPALHERVVLVGHSYGGVGLAVAMERFPEKIAAAVFVTAIMPSPSSSMTTIAEEFFKGHPLEAYMDSKVEITHDRRSFSLAMGSNYLSTKLYQLSPPEDLALATSLLRPGSFFFKDLSDNMVLTEKNYGSVKRAFIVCKEDKAMVEDLQLWMVKRSPPPAEVKEIDGADHMVMLSKPKELCDLLLEVADRCQ
ncbi:hypothetical protein Cni_G04699 [Canna indica]|uniref:AB hydrolase-1 domain-containing protein n=1 Tax=Canna indica TaxID=4628 RepID=A0AAQ3Q4Q3_9LILI|nr:hypothetical protein Cni_G04699 [Canna indica]